MKKQKTIVIGSGLGGLSIALRLIRQGHEVEIIEKNSSYGGRLNLFEKDGFKFDLGPTFFSMSYEFDELIKSTKIEYPFKFIELDPLFSVNLKNPNKKFTIYKDIDKLTEQFDKIEPDFRAKLEKHLKKAEQVYNDTQGRIIHQNFKTFGDYLKQLIKVPLKHAPLVFKSMWQELNTHFESKEARMIFSLVGFFLGATPFDTPGIYSLLNYIELKHDGYHNVKGGMYKIVEGLVSVLKEEGVVFRKDTEIVNFESNTGKITAFIDQNGEKHSADQYVINADAAFFRGKVLKDPRYNDKRLQKMKWTMAPLTIYLGIKGKLDQLDHHNYFLGDEFEKYAKGIYKNKVSLKDPYYYVNVPSKHNTDYAPKDCESVFILCPVPDLRYKRNWDDSQQIVEGIINDLSERIGENLKERIISQSVLTPIDWAKMFNLYQGSGLGLAHNMSQVGYFRPSNKDKNYQNVYYTGASTIPGTGLPMTVISSKLTYKRINHEH